MYNIESQNVKYIATTLLWPRSLLASIQGSFHKILLVAVGQRYVVNLKKNGIFLLQCFLKLIKNIIKNNSDTSFLVIHELNMR